MSALLAVRGAIGWRAAQQAGVQAIYFVRLLILARLLVPEAFGLLAIAMLALSILLSVSDLGIVPALVQRENPDRDEYDAAWTVRLIRAIGVAVALAASAPLIATLFSDSRAAPVIQFLALKPVLEAAGSIGIVRLTRAFRFRQLALIDTPGALLDASVAIALASTFGVWALVAGSLAGAGCAAALSYVVAPHRPRLLFRRATAAPLIQFGRWVLGTSIIGLIATSGIQLVISRELSVVSLGMYYLATKVAFLPADVASSVVGSVAFPLYASLQQDERGTIATLRSLLTVQAVVLCPVYVLIAVLAPSLTEVLRPEWAGAALLIQIISVAALGGLYADTVLPLLMGRGQPHRVTIIIGAQTAVLFLALFPLIAAFGVAGAAAAWLPAYAAAFIMSLVSVRREIPCPLADVGHRLVVVLAVAMAAGAIAWSIQMWLDGVAALVAGGLVGMMTAGAMLGLVSQWMDLGLRDLLGSASASMPSETAARA